MHWGWEVAAENNQGKSRRGFQPPATPALLLEWTGESEQSHEHFSLSFCVCPSTCLSFSFFVLLFLSLFFSCQVYNIIYKEYSRYSCTDFMYYIIPLMLKINYVNITVGLCIHMYARKSMLSRYILMNFIRSRKY